MTQSLDSEAQHAIKISKEWLPDNYDSVVDTSVLNIPYEPDTFQKQAFYFLASHKSVFVSAHTSSGKTLVAEYAIIKSIVNSTRTIYTSPIKALSNQKFNDFKQKYENVGIITGDVQVNTTAQCLIMTTEILRNLLYKNSEIFDEIEYVVFDEVHYVNDPGRGVVWEEVLIMLPKRITLVLLSATIPNGLEFSEWIGRTRQSCIYVISTDKRPVPLEFAFYCNSEAFVLEAQTNKPKPSNFPSKLPTISKKLKIGNDRFRILDLANFISNRRLVPVIFFCFSKKACNAYGRTLENLSLASPQDKKKINEFIDEAISGLREEDQLLPQIQTMRMQASKGIAVHHSGLLPLVRECIEILFSQNLIKILVATETFAVGVNMPAKCCVFLGLTKIDNGRYRMLTGGEFIQMSGRAGRRGMDRVGTVIIANIHIPSIEAIKSLVNGTADNLKSRFRLSFSLILTAIRNKIEVEELMKKSFCENQVQKDLWTGMRRLTLLESKPKFECKECIDIFQLLDCLKELYTDTSGTFGKLVKAGDKLVLKDCSIARCIKRVDGQIYVENTSECMWDSGLFSKRAENTEIFDTKEYPKLPPTLCNELLGTRTIKECDVLWIMHESSCLVGCDGLPLEYASRLIELNNAVKFILHSKSIKCPKFESHYYEAIRHKQNEEQAATIRCKYSRESMIHIDEYFLRLGLLKKHGYVDENGITLKGKAAAEIRTVNEIVTTNLIFKKAFDNFTAEEIATVFSAMISEEELDEDNKIMEEIADKIEILDEEFSAYEEELSRMGIPMEKKAMHGMTNAVFGWCCGKPFRWIVDEYGIQEGAFVRLILRLDECCREMVNVAQLIGDKELEEKVLKASELIKRDVVFTPSLYI